jgi:hypothetical protein
MDKKKKKRGAKAPLNPQRDKMLREPAEKKGIHGDSSYHGH